jgi:hypothetical protein
MENCAMKALLLGAALALTAGLASAQDVSRTANAPAYLVLEANASVPFAGRRIHGYEVAADGRSVIFRAGANEYYRATVWPPCSSDLRYEHRIGFYTENAGGRLDRWGFVLVNGNRCPIDTLDRIAPPERGAG